MVHCNRMTLLALTGVAAVEERIVRIFYIVDCD